MGRIPPNVLKLRKQKRNGRRAYLTSQFSLIHTPRTIGKSDVPESSRPLFDYRKRFEQPSHVTFMSAIMPPEFMNESVKELIREEMWIDRANKDLQVQEILNQTPRIKQMATYIDPSEVLRKRYTLDPQEEEALVALTEHPDQHDVILVKESRLMSSRMSMVYNTKYTHCYFIEVFYRPNGASYVMKSSDIEGRERVTFLMKHPSKIDFIEFLALPSLIPILPRSE